jgi:hypothetical protein
LKDKGNIDRILKYSEIDTIYNNIKKYDVAIFSVDTDRPNVLKLLRAKLLAERFLIAKLKVSFSLNQFVLDNRVCFIVMNIFKHPDFVLFLHMLGEQFTEEYFVMTAHKENDQCQLIIKRGREIEELYDADFYETLNAIINTPLQFEHFHLLQYNTKIITDRIAAQTIERN